MVPDPAVGLVSDPAMSGASVEEVTRLVTTENGPRPAGQPDRCFYCDQRIGEPHSADCVCWQRRVTLRAVIEFYSDEPHSWDKTQIEQHRNRGSWCASNIAEEIADAVERVEAAGRCLCDMPGQDERVVSVEVVSGA